MAESAERPIGSVDELAAYFSAAAKPRHAWRVGTEHEKIGILLDSGAAVPHAGERSILALFHDLMQSKAWAPMLEGDDIIALSRGSARITLEPGGQLELSGAPHARLAETREEISGHLAELAEGSRRLGIAWLALGFRPLGTLEEVPWVPKGRYKIMREYLPTRGRLSLEMMKRTATVQANIDFSDEEDAARKLEAAMSVTSVVTALLANSPIVDGKDSGYASYRARAWIETDPDRCGLVPFVFEAGGDIFRRYVEWALDVPMFFVYRGRYIPARGMTFRRFLREGFAGERATMADWELHVSTLFPEVRLKQYIELRGADTGPLPFVYALPALWKGLLYDDDACRGATSLLAHLSFDQRLALREAVPLEGLRARVPKWGSVRDVARELLVLAHQGLARVAKDEESALTPLDEVVESGLAPADRVRDAFHAAKGHLGQFIEAVRY
ncbi:MAG: glutamate--cysteine ligase [Deltaproteobacteria bacterium]|nr:glutamate--cysteine ligase [Deltaproteobacteria bacterium]